MKKYLTREEVKQNYQDFCDRFNRENNLVLFNGIFVQTGGYFEKNDGIIVINFKNLSKDKVNLFLDKFFESHPEHETNVTDSLILDTSLKYTKYIKD